MAWSAITIDDVLEEVMPQEKAALQAIQADSGAAMAAVFARTVARVRGAIQAGGYALGAAGTVPDQVTDIVIDVTRWRWLVSFPKLKAFQTEERKAAHDKALTRLTAIANQEENIESVTTALVDAAGSWNSDNKLLGRTHPVPRPGAQFQQTGGKPYANDDAPEDAT